MFANTRKSRMPSPEEALPGRAERMPVPEKHFVLGTRIVPPFPAGTQLALFGLGCFWGAEKGFWTAKGVSSTAVGYAAGHTANPTYQEVCTGQTGHNEVVRVVIDPAKVSYADLLRLFWEGHDPTQGMRQGNDGGTQWPRKGSRSSTILASVPACSPARAQATRCGRCRSPTGTASGSPRAKPRVISTVQGPQPGSEAKRSRAMAGASAKVASTSPA